MTHAAAGEPLVEVALRVGADQVELAQWVVGEFSPGGFGHEDEPDGGARFTVYAPVEADAARSLVAALAAVGVEPLDEVTVEQVPDDWAERWREFHQPVVLGGLWIGPPWQVTSAPEGVRRIVVEPGQGFGTGAHPTTRLVLSLLQEQPRSSVLDVGCGSGVLAIAAALLGFGPVTAVDNDPAAIESTRDNLARNDVAGSVRVALLDALQQELPVADLVLANVILEPLVRLAPRMRAPRVVLSGLLRSQVEECTSAYAASGYVLRERRDRDGWAALVLDRADGPDGPAMRHRAVW